MKTFNIKEHYRTIVLTELKNNKLIITAVKMMSDDTDFKTSVSLDASAIKDLKSQKDYHSFRDCIVKKYLVCNKLAVDSKAKKNLLTKNTAYDNTCDSIARAIQQKYRVVETRAKLYTKRIKSKNSKNFIQKKEKKVLVTK
jgi:hypothetical protein